MTSLIDTIIVIMENYEGALDEIRTFLSSLLGFRELHIYISSLSDRIEAKSHMKIII
ncbi:MAG: hypothetical protein QW056_01590 [Candidatus Bathyarchaeia archaeon]